MKILHLCDIHCDNDERHMAEVTEVIEKTVLPVAAREKISLTIIAGDLFDERLALDSIGVKTAIRAVRGLAEIAPVIIMRGTVSHDFGHSLEIFKAIKSSNPITTIDTPEIKVLNFRDGQHLFFFLPGIRKRMFEKLAAKHGLDIRSTTVSQLIELQMKDWKEYRENAGSAKPVLVGHIQLDDVGYAGERGYEPAVSRKLIEQCLDPGIAMLGHIHETSVYGGRFVYAGSLMSNSMMDAKVVRVGDGKISVVKDNSVKGFYIHDWKDGEWKSVFHKAEGRTFLKIQCEDSCDVKTVGGIVQQHMSDKLTVRVLLRMKAKDESKIADVVVFDEALRKLLKESSVEIIPTKIQVESFRSDRRVVNESAWQGLSMNDKFFFWAKEKGIVIPEQEVPEYTAKISVIEQLSPGM